MSGYEQLLDVYEANHQALYERRKVFRESFTALRQALTAKLGIGNDSSAVVLESEDGRALMSVLMTMEHREQVKARVVIALKGASGTPDTNLFIPLQIHLVDGVMSIILPPGTRGAQVIAKPDDFNEAANEIFDYALKTLADF